MPHNEHTSSDRNYDLEAGRTLAWCQNHIRKLGYYDQLQAVKVEAHELRDGAAANVVRHDLLGGKEQFAMPLVSELKRGGVKEMVYVAPRFGHAGIALAKLAKQFGMKLTLFMPACARISDNQALAIELGAEPVFARIAAMPNLNAIADEYAKAKPAKRQFLPLGLKHPLVTAAAVVVAHKTFTQFVPEPREIWSAISTGVLSRALQIAAPQAKFHAVAVARNIHDGEKGVAEVLSHPKAFASPAKVWPTFPCASNYDAKCWEFMQTRAADGAWFWNVAGNDFAQHDYWFQIPADAKWGEIRQLDLNWRKQIQTRVPDFTSL